jgi:hypothetical protein
MNFHLIPTLATGYWLLLIVDRCLPLTFSPFLRNLMVPSTMRKALLFILLLLAGALQVTFGQHLKKDGTPDRRYRENRSYSYHPTRSYHSSYSTRSYSSHRSTYSYSAPRDENGRIKRSESAKHEFMRLSGYPHGRPGYVIDHIKPLKKGGCDCPANMQWQTKAAAKAKDKWE